MHAFYYTRFNSENGLCQQGILNDTTPDKAWASLDLIRIYPGERLIGTIVAPDGKSWTFYDRNNRS